MKSIVTFWNNLSWLKFEWKVWLLLIHYTADPYSPHVYVLLNKQEIQITQSASSLFAFLICMMRAASQFVNITYYMKPKRRLPKPAGCGKQSSSIKEMNCRSFENRIIMSLTSIILSYIYFSNVSMMFIIALWAVVIAWDLPKW